MIDNKITLSDEVIKYYEDLLAKIRSDFKNQKYNEAIQRLEEELEQTYIPFEYQQVFENELHQLENEYKTLQISNELKTLNKTKMLAKIMAHNQFNVYLYDYFLQKFANELNEQDLLAIAEWLKLPYLDNTQKFYVLDGLAHFNVDYNFILVNHNTHDDIVLNTLKFHEHEAFNQYNEVLKIIEKTLFKDPILTKFATDLLDAVTMYYFPSFIFSSADKLAHIILKLINSSMNFEEIKIDELSEEERQVYKIFLEFQSSETR